MDKIKQVVIITGASAGIGLATAGFLVQQGYRVFGTYRKELDEQKLKAAGIEPIKMDVTDEVSIRSAATKIDREMGADQLVALINNAGFSLSVPWSILEANDFRQQLEVNLIGPAVVSKVFLPRLKKDKGKIMMISSTAACYAAPVIGPYTCSKVGLEALADSLRRECLKDGVDVISVRLGPVKTAIFNKTLLLNQEHYGDALKSNTFGNFEKLNKSLKDDGLDVMVVAKKIAQLIKKKKTPTVIMVSRYGWINYIMERLPSRLVDRLCVLVVYGHTRKKQD